MDGLRSALGRRQHLSSTPAPDFHLQTCSLAPPPNKECPYMNRRLILGLAAMLAIGACNDQQEPNTDSQNPGVEPATSTATKPINVVTKTPATAAQLAKLAQYGTVLK